MKRTALDRRCSQWLLMTTQSRYSTLRFRNTGHVYRYVEFTAADNQAFLSAESKGRLPSAITSATSVWPGSTPPDFLP